MRKILLSLIGICIFFVNSNFVRAQTTADLEALKHAVVKITAYNDNEELDIGAGIVVGKRRGYAFILTAFHVIEGSNNLKINFYQDRWYTFEGTNSNKMDARLDIGVVLVKLEEDDEVYKSFRQLSLGKLSQIRESTEVIAIGHPLGVSWQPAPNNRILSLFHDQDGDKMTTTKTAINRGNSGGPLFDTGHNLIGMIIKIDANSAVAVKIDAAKDLLDNWGIPTNLITSAGKPPGPDQREMVWDRSNWNNSSWQ